MSDIWSGGYIDGAPVEFVCRLDASLKRREDSIFASFLEAGDAERKSVRRVARIKPLPVVDQHAKISKIGD